MEKCAKCGSNNWAVVSRIGALETWRCGSCGQNETVHVYDPALDPELVPDLEPVFAIVGRWISRPTQQQIAEAQALFPALQRLSGSLLMRKALGKSEIELGRFTESEMREIEPHLPRLGMKALRTQIPS